MVKRHASTIVLLAHTPAWLGHEQPKERLYAHLIHTQLKIELVDIGQH